MSTVAIGMPGPGRSPFPTIGMSASWKAALWTRIEKLTDHICKIYSQVINNIALLLLLNYCPVFHLVTYVVDKYSVFL